MLQPGIDLTASAISTLTRQNLCSLLDPEDPMGRDWCLLAVRNKQNKTVLISFIFKLLNTFFNDFLLITRLEKLSK